MCPDNILDRRVGLVETGASKIVGLFTEDEYKLCSSDVMLRKSRIGFLHFMNWCPTNGIGSDYMYLQFCTRFSMCIFEITSLVLYPPSCPPELTATQVIPDFCACNVCTALRVFQVHQSTFLNEKTKS